MRTLIFVLLLAACRTDKADPSTDTDGFETDTDADADADGYPASEDCDDNNSLVNPAAEEICDGADNDCDDLVDEDVTSTYYADTDGDGFGDSDVTLEACSEPDGYVAVGNDCDDTAAVAYPGGEEVCDEIDNDCNGSVDDGVGEVFYADTDTDGFGDPDSSLSACTSPTGYVSDGTDCNDSAATINPAAEEVCDEIDNDCDGDVDEGVTTTFYEDTDEDQFGRSDTTIEACAVPPGYTEVPGDCDDGDEDVKPGVDELCDEIDNNCDGNVDEDTATDAPTWYADSDSDGYGDADDAVVSCEAPSDYVRDNTDCDDSTAAANPGATEVCDEIDNDCDKQIDDDDSSVDTSTGGTFYADEDSDGFGDEGSSVEACEQPSGYTEDDTDCDDTDSDVNPDAEEYCGGGDLDCDGVEPDLCGSCLGIVETGHDDGDGLYTIDMVTLGEVEVYCDMTTDGGGWTLAQRTVWDWTESSALHTSYATWYGSTIGSAEEGEAYRMAGEGWSELNVDEDHLLVHYARDSSSTADCDPLYYIGTGGAYTISSSSTSLTVPSASVTMMNTTTLSTTDVGSSTGCVNSYDAVPWFYTSCCTTCPTFLGSYWTDEAHPMASYIDGVADENGYTTADVCPSGYAVSSRGYEGINIMEYYLR